MHKPVGNKNSVNYAGIKPRLLAWGIDTFILIVVHFVLLGALYYIEKDISGAVFFLKIPFFMLLIPWLYYSLFEQSSRQATPGKSLLGLRVLDSHGEGLNLAQTLLRNYLKIFSFFFLLSGFLIIPFTKRKQGLHDLLAGTIVIRHPDKTKILLFAPIVATIFSFFITAIISLTSLAIIIPNYVSMQDRANEARVKNNMHIVDSLLATDFREGHASYPVILGIPGGLENPLRKNTPAVVTHVNAVDSPPRWKDYLPGQVVYVPKGIKDSLAQGYRIYGMGKRNRLSTAIDNSTGLKSEPTWEKEK